MGKWVHRLSKIDRDKKIAVCAECGPISVVLERNQSPQCKTRIDAKKKKYRKYSKFSNYAQYGITEDDYKNQRIKQAGLCGICRDPLREGRFEHLDHDHETGRFRGILCRGCNLGLGNFRDDSKLLQSAVKYLVE